MGAESTTCHPQTGRCECKPGHAGEQCQVCPDGTLADVTQCLGGEVLELLLQIIVSFGLPYFWLIYADSISVVALQDLKAVVVAVSMAVAVGLRLDAVTVEMIPADFFIKKKTTVY